MTVLFRLFSPGGTEISTVSEKGFECLVQSPVEKNSNYDYFIISVFLLQMKSKITNYSIITKTNIVIT